MSEETAESSQAAAVPKKGRMLKIIGIIIVLALIAGGVWFFMVRQQAVAVVNGEKISFSEYSERFSQLAASVAAQGLQATSTEMQKAIKDQTLDNLVSETIVLQEAAKEGIKSQPTEVDTQLSQAKAQFADTAAFEKALTVQGYTERTFKNFLTRSSIIQQYLNSHIASSTATASDAEVKALYDSVAKNNKNVPPMSEVKAQVQAQIITQKKQQLVANLVEGLKAKSKIDILLK